jgi:hypothetical protein
LFLSLLILNLFSFAQEPTGGIRLVNCFQNVDVSSSGAYNFLKGDFRFDVIGTNSNLDYISIEAFDENGDLLQLDPNWYGLYDSDLGYIPKRIVIQKETSSGFQYLTWKTALDMYVVPNGANNKWFSIPDEVSKLKIKTYTNVVDTLHIEGTEIEMNFLSYEESLNLEINNGSSCLSYNNFNLDYSLNVSGFCGNLTSKIKTLPNTIGEPEFSQDYEFGQTENLEHRAAHCAECLNVSALPYPVNPNPVPCGCRTYQLEVTYQACSAMYPCPDVTFIKEISICCNCDVRSITNQN